MPRGAGRRRRLPETVLGRTLFDTPLVTPILRGVAWLWLKIFRWRLERGELPSKHCFVLIAAPHTSNWDLPIMLCAAILLRVKLYWMGKAAIFRPPFAGIVRWLGGIPIDRSKANNLVAQSVELFRTSQTLVLVVPPEGTRQKVRHWKTGFYYIALGAKVPILMGFLDFKHKIAGFGPLLVPTGDIAADMLVIRAFYSGITGKYPDASGVADVAVRQDLDDREGRG
jgi:1-acyl-sn-glycerol-3-phosphate acyltransferase